MTDAVVHEATRLPLETLGEPDLDALVIALLLVAPGPAAVAELAAGADVEASVVDASLARLEMRTGEGWAVQRHAGQVQLVSLPRFAGHVRRFLGLDREAKLSAAALETLAVVAYQQPVTRPEIEGVRGVDSAGVTATLVQRGLIEPVGRLQSPGQPIQYGTTAAFLNLFGLAALADLPPLGEVEGGSAADRLTALTAAVELGADDETSEAGISGPHAR